MKDRVTAENYKGNITKVGDDVISNDTGAASSGDLDLGLYLVVETSAPHPYVAGAPFFVDVPRTAPTDVAIASARSAGLILGSFSFSSSIPAFVDTPISVQSVSKISTKRNAKSTTIKSRILMLEKSALKHCPNVSPIAVISIILSVGYNE